MLRGESSIRRLTGIHGIPDGLLLGATVDIDRGAPGQLKNIPLCRQTAAEALADAGIDLETLDRDRVGCSIGAHMGDSSYVVERTGPERRSAPSLPWRTQSLPNTACDVVVNEFDLRVGQRNTGDTSRHLADWREILSNGCIKRMLSHAPRRS
ncbi:MAG TPA: beta-ketoacyl synthase N-terminal-like domain-containing protein [Lacipirellulaceae bacterium]|nr:beta-ketoacyl synthase N-terminal-like domain-containing protein [Lacipirellulaceae bacterium]